MIQRHEDSDIFNLDFDEKHRTAVLSFNHTALFFHTFCVTAVTVARNGYTCGSHALYVCQGCQAACLTRIGSTEWRLVISSAAVFIDLSLRPSTVPTRSVASFDYDEWT